jgi:hypothetical protein
MYKIPDPILSFAGKLIITNQGTACFRCVVANTIGITCLKTITAPDLSGAAIGSFFVGQSRGYAAVNSQHFIDGHVEIAYG